MADYKIQKNDTATKIAQRFGISVERLYNYEDNFKKIKTLEKTGDKRGLILEGDVLKIPDDLDIHGMDSQKALGQPEKLSAEVIKVTAENPASKFMEGIQEEIDELNAYNPKRDKVLQEDLAVLDSAAQKQLKNVDSSGVLSPEGKVQKRKEITSELAAAKSEMVTQRKASVAKELESARMELARYQTVHQDWPSVQSKMSEDAKQVVKDLTKGLPDKEQVALKVIAAELVDDGVSLKQPVTGANGRIHYVTPEMKEKEAYNDSEPRYHANFLLESLDYTARNKGQVSDALKAKMNEMYAKCKTLSDSEPKLREKLVSAYKDAYGDKAAEMMPPGLQGKVSVESKATSVRSTVGVGTVLAPGLTYNPAMSGPQSSVVVKNGAKVMTTAAAATGVGLTKQSKQALQNEYKTEAAGDALLRNQRFQEALQKRGMTDQKYTEEMMEQLDAYLKSGKADLSAPGESAPVDGKSRFEDPEFKKQFYKAYMERFIELSNAENQEEGKFKDVDIADCYITAITMTALEKAKNKKGGTDSASSATQAASAGKEQSTSGAKGVDSQATSNGVERARSAATAAPTGTNSGAFTNHATLFDDLGKGKNFPSADHGQFVAYMLGTMATNINAMVPDSPAQRKHIEQMQLTVANLAIGHAKDTATFAKNVSTAVKNQTDAYLVSAAAGLPMPTAASNEPSARPAVETQQAVTSQQSEAKAVQIPATQSPKLGTAEAPYKNLQEIKVDLSTRAGADPDSFLQVDKFLKGLPSKLRAVNGDEAKLVIANTEALQFLKARGLGAPSPEDIENFRKAQ